MENKFNVSSLKTAFKIQEFEKEGHLNRLGNNTIYFIFMFIATFKIIR